MKTSEFEMIGLKELEPEEINLLKGGWFPIALTIALIVSAINNFGEIREGLADGFNGNPRY